LVLIAIPLAFRVQARRFGSTLVSRGRRDLQKMILWSALSIASAHWAGHSLLELLHGPTAIDGAFFVGSLALFLVGMLWAYDARSAFALLRTLEQHALKASNLKTTDARALTLLLSTPNATLLECCAPGSGWTLDPRSPKLASQANSVAPKATQLGGKDLDIDIEAITASRIRWNWQQLLRAVRVHRSSLQRVHLLGSSRDGGSYPYTELCAKWLRGYLPGATVNASLERSVDFENLDDLRRSIMWIIRQERDLGLADREIFVDVTGGMKTASIAAAAVTLNTDVRFQYVQTDEPSDVLVFNAKLELLGAFFGEP